MPTLQWTGPALGGMLFVALMVVCIAAGIIWTFIVPVWIYQIRNALRTQAKAGGLHPRKVSKPTGLSDASEALARMRH